MGKRFYIVVLLGCHLAFGGCKQTTTGPNNSGTSVDTTLFWQAGGPVGTSDIYALAIIPQSQGTPDVVLAGADSGILRSSDGGVTWSRVLGGDSRRTVFCLAVDSAGSAYAGTSGFGVYKSGDGVTWFPSWNPSSTGYAGGAVTTIAAHPSGALFLNIVDWGGPYRSEDGGVTFSSLGSLYGGGGVGNMYIDSTGTVYFVYGAVDVSSDVGQTWHTIGQTTQYLYTIVRTDGFLIACGQNGDYRSSDNGATSQTLAAPGESINSIVANTDGVLYAASFGNKGIFRSTDRGTSWVQVNVGLTNTNVESLVIDREGYLFAGTKGGVYRSIHSTVP